MPRDQEALGYWLSRRDHAPTAKGRASTPRLLAWLSRGLSHTTVHECDLDFAEAATRDRTGWWWISAEVREAGFGGEALGTDMQIKDGLDALSQTGLETAGGPADRRPDEDKTVRTARLLTPGRIRQISTPARHPPHVRAIEPLPRPRLHQPVWIDPRDGVQIRSEPPLKLGSVREGSAFLGVAEVRVSDGGDRMRAIPLARRAVAPNEVSTLDREAYVREAETLRGVPPGRGELVAVFPQVPVEVVTGIRLTGDSGTLLFTASVDPRRTKTRVHHLAAVRDTEHGVLHLVPHRTRYRTAFLR